MGFFPRRSDGFGVAQNAASPTKPNAAPSKYNRYPKHEKLPPYTTQDVEWAQLLHTTVNAYTGASRVFAKADWAHEFRRLRKEVRGEAERVDRVLLWFIEHYREPGIPTAFTARGFRKKFLQIEHRRRELLPELAEAFTEEEVKLHDGLKLLWPEVNQGEILPLIHDTLQTYRRFLRAAMRLHDRLGQDQVHGSMWRYLHAALPSSTDFTVEWMHRAHEIVWLWESWRGGSILTLRLKLQGKRFQSWFAEFTDYWGGPGARQRVWRQIEQEMDRDAC